MTIIVVWTAWIGATTAGFALLAARTRAQVVRCLLVGSLVAVYLLVSLVMLRVVQPKLVGAGHYPFLGKGIITLALLMFAHGGIGPTPAASGMTSFGHPGSWRFALAAAAANLVLCFLDPSVPWEAHSNELLLYEATMPGLDEELFFRGLLLALLREVFPAASGARGLGWPLVVTSVAFAWLHVFHVDTNLQPHVELAPLTLASLLLFGALMVWLRERTGTLWWPVLVHNLGNVAVVLYAR